MYSDDDLAEIIATGERLPDGMRGPGLLDAITDDPIFDGVNVVEGSTEE